MFLITKKINADTLLADMVALGYYPFVNGIPQFLVRLKITSSFFDLAVKQQMDHLKAVHLKHLTHNHHLLSSTQTDKVLWVRLLGTPTVLLASDTVYLLGCVVQEGWSGHC